MPEEDKNKLTFQNHHKQLPVPFIIYADLEAHTNKVEGPELDPSKSKTQRTQHYEACSYSYIVVRCDVKTEPPVDYRGPNEAELIFGFGSLVILDVARCYLWLFTLYININIGKNSC